MKRETRGLLHKASRAIRAAETLRQTEDLDFAAGRAYYAMFYAAEALLVERGLQFRRHGGVHAAFGEHFVKTGLLDTKLHRWLLDAFDRRILADYGVEAIPSDEDVAGLIEHAREFLEAVPNQLERT